MRNHQRAEEWLKKPLIFSLPLAITASVFRPRKCGERRTMQGDRVGMWVVGKKEGPRTSFSLLPREARLT